MRTQHASCRVLSVVFLLAVVCLAGPAVASQWHHLSGGAFNGISSVGEKVWVVGQDGLFYQSSDNGAHWRRVPRFTSRNLLDVEFWDGGLGLVTAEGDWVYRTTDAGMTWDSTWVINSAGKLRFITRDAVWLTLPGRALLSSDGGQSWRQRECGDPSAIHWFLDSLQGWAAVGSVVRSTTDGGRAWGVGCSLPRLSEFETDYGLKVVCFTDSGTGVVARAVTTQVGHLSYNRQYWYVTTNAGLSWNHLSSRDGWPSLRGVDLDNEGDAYILAGDGCWAFESPDLRFAPLDALSIDTNPTDVSASRGANPWVIGSGLVVQTSTDRGASWTAVRPGTGGSMRGVAFYDSACGVGISRWTAVKTVDAGRTWEPTLLAPRRGTGFAGLSLVPPASAYVTRDDCFFVATQYYGDFEIHKTEDRGCSWSLQLRRSDWYGRAFAAGPVCFLDAQHGWHPGGIDQVTSVRTTNGGQSWLDMMSDPSWYTPLDVSFGDTLVGWWVDGRGLVRKTVDGGDSWSLQWSSTPLKRMQMLSLQDGWALAAAGIMRTTNGGDSWTLTFSAESLNAFHFADRQNGVAVGQSGRIFRTNDSGQTWIRDSCEFDSHLYSAYVLDSTHMWVGGVNGLVFGYGDRALGQAEPAGPGQAPAPVRSSVHPNPCRDQVVLQVGTTAGAELELRDVAGRRVRRVALPTGCRSMAVDLRGLPAGVYLVTQPRAVADVPIRLVKVE